MNVRAPLSDSEIQERLDARPGWSGDTNEIQKTFKLHYDTSMRVVAEIATSAIELEHRPDIDIRWDALRIAMTTHTAGDVVTELDFLLVDRIERIVAQHSD